MNQNYRIAVVGIGRVGLPLAAVLSKFYDTIGIDKNAELIHSLNNREQRFIEPRLQEYIDRYGLKFDTRIDPVEECDAVFVCVGTQKKGSGYSPDNVMNALRDLENHLNNSEQILVIVSTVPPNTFKHNVLTDNIIKKIKGICHNPTMISLGDAIRGFENPDYLIIGESSREAGDVLERLWRRVVGNDVPVFKTSLDGAAVIKYALNAALVLRISMMSFLTELCEKTGGDIDLISSILAADPRIAGTKMLKGGLGFGGTCFPIDVDALLYVCRELGVDTGLMNSVWSLNRRQVERSVNFIKSFGRKKIGILGLTYKPNTNILENSQSLEIAVRLADEGLSVMVYDPSGIEQIRNLGLEKLTIADNMYEVIKSSEVIFIGVDWPEFRLLEAKDFRNEMVVIDPWRILRHKRIPCRYYGYGIG